MPRILLVEDSAVQARALMSYFELTDYDIVRTERLEDALAYVQQNPADAVLLDLTLPDSLGLETFLRMQEAARRMPIVVLTSTDDEELALELLRRGAQDYLIKGEVTSDWVRRSLQYAIQRFAAAQRREVEPRSSEPPGVLNRAIEQVGDITIVRVQVAQLMDVAPIEQLSADLQRLAEQRDRRKFVLDCGNLEYVANSALAQLLAWDQRIRKLGGSLRICNLRPDVQDQMKVRKLLAQFNICLDLQTALAGF